MPKQLCALNSTSDLMANTMSCNSSPTKSDAQYEPPSGPQLHAEQANRDTPKATVRAKSVWWALGALVIATVVLEVLTLTTIVNLFPPGLRPVPISERVKTTAR